MRHEFNEQADINHAYGLLFEQVFRQVAVTTGEEKLKAYVAILVNAALASSPDDMEREYFLSRVASLDEVHIVVLVMLQGDEETRERLRPRLRDSGLAEGAY